MQAGIHNRPTGAESEMDMADETGQSNNPHPGTASAEDIAIAGAEAERENRDTAAQAILDGDIDQETGEHDDEVLEELEIDEDDELDAGEVLSILERQSERIEALESILRRILAEPQLLACGDKAFCNELGTLLDQTN